MISIETLVLVGFSLHHGAGSSIGWWLAYWGRDFMALECHSRSALSPCLTRPKIDFVVGEFSCIALTGFQEGYRLHRHEHGGYAWMMGLAALFAGNGTRPLRILIVGGLFYSVKVRNGMYARRGKTGDLQST